MDRLKKIVKSLFFNLLIFHTIIVSAQNINISGMITDKNTGNPIPNVTILFKNTTIGTISNDKGFYKLWTDKHVMDLQILATGYKELIIPLDSVIDGILNIELSDKVLTVKGKKSSSGKKNLFKSNHQGVSVDEIKTKRIK